MTFLDLVLACTAVVGLGVGAGCAMMWRANEILVQSLKRSMNRHKCIFDTFEVHELPSEFDGMVKSLGFGPLLKKLWAQWWEPDELREMLQPRIVIRRSCACGNSEAVVVIGQDAKPFLEDANPVLATYKKLDAIEAAERGGGAAGYYR